MKGFLGTRADLLMDLVVVAIVATPFIMMYAFGLARKKRFHSHRNIQTILLVLLLGAVCLFKTDIRIFGGTEAFLRGSPFAGTAFLRSFLAIHILIACCSFMGWLVLNVLSWKNFLKALPGDFSESHRFWGKAVYCGVVFTSSTGVALYILGFVI